MTESQTRTSGPGKRFRKKKLAYEIGLITSALALSATPVALAQDATADDADTAGIEEIIVTGIRGSIVAGIESKRNAPVIVDSISAEDIGKFPDANLAEALQRIPGAAIDRDGGEGRYLTIRGLGPEFNSVLLNGRRLATTDATRAFSFDTVAADLVSALDVYKTQQAGMQEGALGGTVDVRTARPLDFDGLTIRGTLKGLFEEHSDSTDVQASFLISDKFMDDRAGWLLALSYQERDNETYAISSYDTRTERTFYLSGYTYAYSSGSYGDTYRPNEIDTGVSVQSRERTGMSGALQFQPTDDLDITIDYLYSKFDVESSNFDNGSWLWQVDPPASAATDPGFNMAPWEADAIAATSLTALDENGVFTRISRGRLWGGTNSRAYNLNVTKRPTETQMLGINFDYQINDSTTLEVDASWSTADLNNPDGNYRLSTEMLEQPPEVWDLSGRVPYLESGPESMYARPENFSNLLVRRNWNSGSDIEADDIQLGADLDFDVSDTVRIRVGALYETSEKTNETYTTPNQIDLLYHQMNPGWNFTQAMYDQIIGGIIDVNPSDFGLPASANHDIFAIDAQGYIDWINDPANAAMAVVMDPNKEQYYDAFVENGGFQARLTGDSWGVEEAITSFYIDADFDFDIGSIPASLTAGVRYTHTALDAVGFSRIVTDLIEFPCPNQPPGAPEVVICLEPIYAPVDGPEGLTRQALSNSYNDVLPSLNLKMHLTEDLIFRLAGSKSLTRPYLEDMAPKFRPGGMNPEVRTATSGNENLTPYRSVNFDTSLEWYYAPGCVAAVAYFTKDVDDFIVRQVVDGVTVDTIAQEEYQDFTVTMPWNAESARINGATVNWTHTMDSGFGFQFNITVVDTNKEFDGNVFDQSQIVIPGLGDTMNLVGFYEKGPFAARIAYNQRDAFLRSSQFPSGVWGELLEEPRFARDYDQIDARISYAFGNYTVSLEGINLGNSILEEYGRYDNVFIGRYNWGRRFLVGVSGKF